MIKKNWNSNEINNIFSLDNKKKILINKICINSKLVKKEDLFIPLKGKNFDGHEFVSDAFKKGASLALSNKYGYKKFNLKKFKKKIILVKDPLISLHKFASYSRNRSKGKFLAITGSVGKTSVKEAISFILKKKNKIQYSEKNFNNLIGMPLNLANFNKNSDINILELGMNKKGEIKKLSKICKPDICLITKITNAHIGNFKSIRDIVLAKSEIFFGVNQFSTAIINYSDPFYDLLKKQAKLSGIKNIVSFGKNKECDVRLLKYKNDTENSYKIFFDVLGKKINFRLKNLGEHWIENSLSIAAVINVLGKDLKFYMNRMSHFKALEGRGKIIKISQKNKKFVFIDDTYNSSPESLKSSIKFLNHIGKNRRKICVIGDMFELGKFSKKLHLSFKKILKDNKISSVYTIGDKMKILFMNLPKEMQTKHSKNLDELYLNLKENINNNDIILFKGSRAIKLDQLINKFI